MLEVGRVRIVAADALPALSERAVAHRQRARELLDLFMAAPAQGCRVIQQQLGLLGIVRVVTGHAQVRAAGVAELARQRRLEILAAIDTQRVAGADDRAGLLRVLGLMALLAFAVGKRRVRGRGDLIREQRLQPVGGLAGAVFNASATGNKMAAINFTVSNSSCGPCRGTRACSSPWFRPFARYARAPVTKPGSKLIRCALGEPCGLCRSCTTSCRCAGRVLTRRC